MKKQKNDLKEDNISSTAIGKNQSKNDITNEPQSDKGKKQEKDSNLKFESNENHSKIEECSISANEKISKDSPIQKKTAKKDIKKKRKSKRTLNNLESSSIDSSDNERRSKNKKQTNKNDYDTENKQISSNVGKEIESNNFYEKNRTDSSFEEINKHLSNLQKVDLSKFVFCFRNPRIK